MEVQIVVHPSNLRVSNCGIALAQERILYCLTYCLTDRRMQPDRGKSKAEPEVLCSAEACEDEYLGAHQSPIDFSQNSLLLCLWQIQKDVIRLELWFVQSLQLALAITKRSVAILMLRDVLHMSRVLNIFVRRCRHGLKSCDIMFY